MKGKIFSSSGVHLIIAGLTTQFREEINNKLIFKEQTFQSRLGNNRRIRFINPDIASDRTKAFKCPYKVGKQIFVKESFVDYRNNNSEIFYKSDFEVNNLLHPLLSLKWKSASRMKQEQSRILLEITKIDVAKEHDLLYFWIIDFKVINN